MGTGGLDRHAATTASARRAGLRGDGGANDGRFLTVRERMEQHRANPVCMACHQVIDPIGLALENFDVTGAWRIRDEGQSDRPGRGALRRHSASRSGRPQGGPSEPPRGLLPSLHVEPHGLRVGPARRVLRYADGAKDYARRGGAQISLLIVRCGGRYESGLPHDASGGTGDGRCGLVARLSRWR